MKRILSGLLGVLVGATSLAEDTLQKKVDIPRVIPATDVSNNIQTTLSAPMYKERATQVAAESLDERIKRHEGMNTKMYKDNKGIPTIGYGLNLTRKDAPKMLEIVGANYERIMSGKQELTIRQVNLLYDLDRGNLDYWARVCVKNYDSHPQEVKDIIAEMAFNCGATGFKRFKKTINALEAQDYRTAADEMKDSKWYKQTGKRAVELVGRMRDAANKYQKPNLSK